MSERAVVILRLGNTQPCEGDFKVMQQLSDGDLKDILGASLPMGVISILNTDRSNQEIIDLYKGVESENDIYPVMVWDLESVDFNIYLSEMEPIWEGIKEAYENTLAKQRIRGPILKTIDEVLDKINREGMGSLSEQELALLKKGN
jgi:hypothetical protein